MLEDLTSSRTDRILVSLAWVLASFGAVSVTLGLFWANQAGFAPTFPWPAVLSGSLVCLAIVIRRPRNLFAWEVLIVCVVVDFIVGMEGYWYRFGASDPTPSAFAVWIWWIVQVLSTPTFVFVAVGLPLLFPTGKAPSSRWNWVGWTALAAVILSAAAWASAPNLCALPLDTDAIPLNPSSDCSPPIASPWIWFTGVTARLVSTVWLPLLAISTLGAVASMVARYRTGDTKERVQMKWYLMAMIASLALLTTSELLGFPVWIGQVGYLFVPAGLAVAILRHQLFDIDRLISRSISYSVVAGALGAVFFVLVSVPSLIIGGTGKNGSLASTPPVVVAGSTLAVAALFNPVRRRTRNWVEKRFNRTRYVAERELEGFVSRLRGESDIGIAENDLLAVVVRTLQPSSIGFWTTNADRT